MRLLKQTSVRSLLIGLTTLLCLDIASLAIQGIFELQGLLATAQHLSRVTVPSVSSMTLVDMMHDGIRANVLDALLLATGHSPSTSKEISDEAADYEKRAADQLAKLKSLPLSAVVRAEVEAAIPQFESYIAAAQSIRMRALAGNLADAKTQLPAFVEQFERLEKSLGQLGEDIEAAAAATQKITDEEATSGIRRYALITIISILVGAGASFAIIRWAMRTITVASTAILTEATSVSAGAARVDASANELAMDVESQSTSLQQTAATVHEISEMARQSAENAGGVRQAATAAVDVAAGGKARVQELVSVFAALTDIMTSVQSQVAESNSQFADVANVISEIGTKTQVINEIVFQTKLLSFNASVEAARAGEHGKGFSVVAEEVGNLARSSGDAAQEISKLLKTSRERVDETVQSARDRIATVMDAFSAKLETSRKLVGECDTALDSVVGMSRQVQTKIDQISGALGEQSSGVNEMSDTLQLFGARVENSHKEAAASAATAADMLASALALRRSIDDMTSKLGAKVAHIEERMANDPENEEAAVAA